MYLPGLFAVPPVDRDESRFAQASKQMALSESWRGWMVPRIADRIRMNKPPLVYWLQAAIVRAAGAAPSAPIIAEQVERAEIRGELAVPTGGIGWYRIPSVCSAIGTSLITCALGVAMFPRARRRRLINAGVIAGCLIGTCVVVMWEARQARADQLMLFWTTVSMALLWVNWRRRDHPKQLLLPCALWVSVGLGVMSKGPITPMVVLLGVVVLAAVRGEWRWIWRLRPIVGVVIVGAMLLPWVALVAEELGWRTVYAYYTEEIVGHALDARESHWGPPGYHLVLLAVMFWPGSMLTASALCRLLRRRGGGGVLPVRVWRGLGRIPDGELFCLAWLVPGWIIFELSGTKLPHYVMPLYPPIALLTARLVAGLGNGRLRTDRHRGITLGLVVWALIGLGVCVGIPAGFAIALDLRSTGVMRALTFGLVSVSAVLVIASTVLGARQRWIGAYALAVIAAVVSSGAVFGTIFPRVERLWLSSRVMAAAAEAGALDDAIGGWEYAEDSLVFLTDGRLERLGGRRAVSWAAANPEGLLVLVVQPDASAAAAGLAPGDLIADIEGVNYNEGLQRLWLIRARALPLAAGMTPKPSAFEAGGVGPGDAVGGSGGPGPAAP